MKKIFLTLAILFIFSSDADAIILYQENITVYSSTRADNVPADVWTFYWGYPAGSSFVHNFSTVDNGTQTILNSGAIFDDLSATLTNGVDDTFLKGETHPGGSSELNQVGESSYFSSSVNQLNGVDFQGFTIESFLFDIVRVEKYDDVIEFGEGEFRDVVVFELDADFYVNGTSTIPEPATMLLFGTGLAGACIRKRKANKGEVI